MKYISTRSAQVQVEASQAIVQGLCKSGGLYVPKEFPIVQEQDLIGMYDDEYYQVAAKIMGLFLSEFSKQELSLITKEAYGENFKSKSVAPVVQINKMQGVLELFHGPTHAFKDIALQILPKLMSAAMKKIDKKEKVLVLVATSGDTGKAALEGFKDIEDTAICVFYPQDGVSEVQKLQMQTQEGKNVDVCSIVGNFDDAQTGVKKIFSNKEFSKQILKECNFSLSSANSINWGRLVPQITYYFWSYIKAVNNVDIEIGNKVNFVVPTGNFGNILAGYYAKQMGLPINKLICASNNNNVLTDFFGEGVYRGKREFFKTVSPSMDIIISSNLERLLFEICDRDQNVVSDLMQKLSTQGEYSISKKAAKKLEKDFFADFATEEETLKTIKSTFFKYEYLMDTHTAVAQCVYEKYIKKTNDTTYSIVISTASPYKFAGDVLSAFEIKKDLSESTQEEIQNELYDLSKIKVPETIANLSRKQIHFTKCLENSLKMQDHVLEFLKSQKK